MSRADLQVELDGIEAALATIQDCLGNIEDMKLGRHVAALVDCVREARAMGVDATKLLTNVAYEAMDEKHDEPEPPRACVPPFSASDFAAKIFEDACRASKAGR